MKFNLTNSLTIILGILVLFSFVVPFVSAANPHTTATDTNNGLIITSIFPDTIKQNSNYTFYWYVQNQTNSAFMDNNSISCAFEIYKSSGLNGLHLIDMKGTFDGVEEWSVYVGPGNFSTIGNYIERVKCNSTINTGLGGIADNQFIVTSTGRDYSTFNFIPLLIAVLGAMLILVILAIACGESHPILSVLFAGVAIFMIPSLLAIGLTYLDNALPIYNNVNMFQQMMAYVCYGVGIYMLAYVTVKVLTGLGQKKQEKFEGLL